MTDLDTHLTTGWEPSVDPADTMTRRYLFHWAATAEAFASAAGGRVLRTPWFVATDVGGPSGYFNAIVLLAPPTSEEFDDVVAAIDRFVGDQPNGFDLWSLWPTPDLRPLGWQLSGHPPLLVRPPAAVQPAPAAQAPEPEIHLVTDEARLRDWELVAIEGYPLPEVDADRPGAIAGRGVLDDPRLTLWVGYEGDRPVSVGTLFAEDDLAGFALGVTRPESRGRGHWAAHARRRLDAAPGVWMSGVFSDFSRPLAERIGFVPITRFTLWSLDRKQADQ